MTDLVATFDSLEPPTEEGPGGLVYAATRVEAGDGYLVGKDSDSRACIIFATGPPSGNHPAPIRLASLDVEFQLHCRLKGDSESHEEGWFTVVSCRSVERETVRYFFSVGESLIRVLGERPAQDVLAAAVYRLASIFQEMHRPPARSLDGLFGELYLIWRSANPKRALAAWRTDTSARFDFSCGSVRLEVKTTSRRTRSHIFSYEQCSPPDGTVSAVASMFVERTPGGVTVEQVICEIEHDVSVEPDLVFKLHEVVASTLGDTLVDALPTTYDAMLTDASLLFFNVGDIPAIRGSLPDGVSDVHFRADLSRLEPTAPARLVDRDPLFWDLLPRRDETAPETAGRA